MIDMESGLDGLESFSLTDLRRRTGDVFNAADEHPVLITKRGDPAFILMSHRHFNLMSGQKIGGQK